MNTIYYHAVHSELHVMYGVENDEHFVVLFNEYTGELISKVKIDGPVTSISSNSEAICLNGHFIHYGEFVCPSVVTIDHTGKIIE
jgi:hypothetical protein